MFGVMKRITQVGEKAQGRLGMLLFQCYSVDQRTEQELITSESEMMSFSLRGSKPSCHIKLFTGETVSHNTPMMVKNCENKVTQELHKFCTVDYDNTQHKKKKENTRHK